MAQNLRDFWHRFQSGVDVAVAGELPDTLLGVRDGFLRYFDGRAVAHGPIAVLPFRIEEPEPHVPFKDEEILTIARSRARELREGEGDRHAFYVGTETSVASVSDGDVVRQLVHCWAVVIGLDDEAWGASGAVQLPERLIAGLDQHRLPFAVPGRRRSGGTISSLTGGLESRRSATSLATFHALSTLTYGLLEGRRPVR
jgi:non-canonical (house-cleaning) NTP pyrophosphatase